MLNAGPLMISTQDFNLQLILVYIQETQQEPDPEDEKSEKKKENKFVITL
jgi:hypothetical protein